MILLVKNIYSQKQKDTLFFSNGSIVIGEIKQIKLGVVTFDPDDANDITVQLRKLKSIDARSRVFRIETVHNLAYFGMMTPKGRDKYVWVVQGNKDSTVLHLEEISKLYSYEKSVVERITGKIGAGYSYTRSSNFGRLNFDGSLRYATHKGELTLAFSGIYTIEDSLFSRDQESMNLKYNYYFLPSWFATTFFAYQRNIELGLDRRFQEGIGIGNKFITSKTIYAWLRAGFVWNQEKSTEKVTTGTLTELFTQCEFNLYRFANPHINFTTAQSFFYNYNNQRFRWDGHTTLTWEVVSDLDLNMSFYNNYDSKPPVEGGAKTDYGIVFGLSYAF